jgi:DNA-binding transcriptional regulator YdaS (Cro superfamily)
MPPRHQSDGAIWPFGGRSFAPAQLLEVASTSVSKRIFRTRGVAPTASSKIHLAGRGGHIAIPQLRGRRVGG